MANDILFIFPVVILASISLAVGLSVSQPYSLLDKANPFATPLEILPEWYFLPTFNLLRVLPSKLIGVLSMSSVPLILLLVPFLENSCKFQNPFRRSASSIVFGFATGLSFWLAFGSLDAISL